MLAPHARDHHVADTKMSSEFASTPVRRSIRGGAPSRFQNAGLESWGQNCGGLAKVTAVETSEALFAEASAPTGHKPTTASDVFAHVIPRVTLGEQQDHPRPP